MTESTDEPTVLVIHNEDEAWAALEKAVSLDGFPDNLQLRFDGWPTFTLDVKGRDWHSTVPTRVMPPLLAVQKDLHRAYCQVRYGAPNLRRLREDERNDLEVVVKVNEGSSLLNAELWEQLGALGEAAVGRMSGPEIVLTVLGVALLAVSPVMFRIWQHGREKEKGLETQVELSQQETTRLKIATEAMRQQPVLTDVHADAQATYSKLLKAMKPGDRMEIHGNPLTSAQAAELVQPEREEAKQVELSGTFVFLGNRTDKGKGFRITVQRIADALELHADVQPELSADQKEILKQAEWSKGPVNLVVHAEKLHDAFVRAEVISAREARSDADD